MNQLSVIFDWPSYFNRHNPIEDMCGSREAPGGPYRPLEKIIKLYDSLAILVRNPWKITKHSMLDHAQPTNKRPQRHLNGVSLAHLKWYWDPLSLLINWKSCQSWSRLTPFLDAHGGDTQAYLEEGLYAICLINAYLSWSQIFLHV